MERVMTIPALQFEVKKDGFSQLQSGAYKLTLTLNPTDLDDNGQGLLLDFIKAPMGQRYMLGMAAIGDDEQPIASEPKKAGPPTQRFQDFPRAKQAALKCKEVAFVEWLEEDGEEGAAMWVRAHCRVQSRAELDTNDEAGDLWDKLFATYEQETSRMAEAR
jgi:hypothetical protein